MRRVIVLTGPMGSGKTSVGRLLAARLGWEFVDLDHLVEQAAGSCINDLFAERGEVVFRQLEHQQLASLVGRHRMVLSTGGGAVLSRENRVLLRRLGAVVNLTAPVAELARRLAAADDRPLLRGGESLTATIARLLQEREPFYAESDIRIDTTAKSVEDVAAELLKRLAEGQ